MTARFTRPQLVDLYCTRRLSTRAIAKLCGCSATKARMVLRAYGIPRRKQGGRYDS